MKTNIRILLLLLLSIPLVATYAQDTKAMFQTANSYYQNKQYDEAEKLYLMILKKDKNNANAYYNLGNTYFHLQQYSNAVLYYERAKKLHPDSKQIQHNIDLTNNKLFSKMEFSKEFFVTKKIKGLAHTQSSNTWSIYFLTTLWLAVVLLSFHFLKSKPLAFKSGALLLVLALLFSYFTYITYQSEHRNDFAIVMTANTYLQKSPVASSDTTNAVKAGTKIKIIDTDKNWCKIQLPNDKTGWIAAANIELI